MFFLFSRLSIRIQRKKNRFSNRIWIIRRMSSPCKSTGTPPTPIGGDLNRDLDLAEYLTHCNDFQENSLDLIPRRLSLANVSRISAQKRHSLRLSSADKLINYSGFESSEIFRKQSRVEEVKLSPSLWHRRFLASEEKLRRRTIAFLQSFETQNKSILSRHPRWRTASMSGIWWRSREENK